CSNWNYKSPPLERTRAVHVTLHSDAGAVVSGAQIAVYSNRQSQNPRLILSSDSTGSASFVLHDGDSLIVSKDGYVERYLADWSSVENELALELPRAALLRGRVTARPRGYLWVKARCLDAPKGAFWDCESSALPDDGSFEMPGLARGHEYELSIRHFVGKPGDLIWMDGITPPGPTA